MGLVNAVTDEPTRWWVDLVSSKLSNMSASSLRFAERATRIRLRDEMLRHLPDLEQLYLAELMKTPDANEGIASFMERRPPVFTHASSK